MREVKAAELHGVLVDMGTKARELAELVDNLAELMGCVEDEHVVIPADTVLPPIPPEPIARICGILFRR